MMPAEPLTEIDELFMSFHATYLKLRIAGFSKSEACKITATAVLEIVFGWEGADSGTDDDV